MNRRIRQIQQSQSENTSVSSREKIVETGADILPATPIVPDSEPLSSPIQSSPISQTHSLMMPYLCLSTIISLVWAQA